MPFLVYLMIPYKSRHKHRLNINDQLANIFKIKKLDKATAFGNVKK